MHRRIMQDQKVPCRFGSGVHAGVSTARLSQLYKDIGDLGDVAAQCKGRQGMLLPLPVLTVNAVFGQLRALAETRGARSAARKQDIIAKLMRACRYADGSCQCARSASVRRHGPCHSTRDQGAECAVRVRRGPEILYITRTLIRNLRVGANWRSVVSALGRAAACNRAEAAAVANLAQDASSRSSTVGSVPCKQTLDTAAQTTVAAFHRCPNLARIIEVLMRAGVGALESECGVQVAVPVKPMLASIVDGFSGCEQQLLGHATLAEFKYDGQRAQIHVDEQGQVRCLSIRPMLWHHITRRRMNGNWIMERRRAGGGSSTRRLKL